MEVMHNDRRDDTASYGYVHITAANHIGDDAAGWLNEVIRRWSQVVVYLIYNCHQYGKRGRVLGY